MRAADVLNTPDEKSIMTYLSSYYRKFAQEEQDSLGNKRLQKVIGFEMEIQEEEMKFEFNSEGLAEWIEKTIVRLNDHNFANSVAGVQATLAEFKAYRTEEKPPKFTEKGFLESQLFKIQMQLREANRNPWNVPEDKHVAAINNGWEDLEKAEHNREIALRDALQRQERLAQMAANFNRKADLREQWLADMQSKLDRESFGDDLASTTAAAKKEDTIQLQVNAYAERLQGVGVMAQTLAGERYHDADAIVSRSEAVFTRWRALADTMSSRRARLDHALAFWSAGADIDASLKWIAEMSRTVQSDNKGRDRNEAEALLQQHTVDEGTIESYELTSKRLVSRHIETFSSTNNEHLPALQARKVQLDEKFARLRDLSAHRRRLLGQAIDYQRFMEDMREEEAWIRERLPIVMSSDLGNNLTSALVLQKKHLSLVADIAIRQKASIEVVADRGKALIADRSYAAHDIKRSMDTLGILWTRLKQFAAARKVALDTAVLAEQYKIDSNEAESWMSEREAMATSEEVGRDQSGAEQLRRAHLDTIQEINVFRRIVDDLAASAQNVRARAFMCVCECVFLCCGCACVCLCVCLCVALVCVRVFVCLCIAVVCVCLSVYLCVCVSVCVCA
jgi:spectrin beta